MEEQQAENDGPVNSDEQVEAIPDEAQDEASLMKAEMEEALREKEQFKAMAQRAQADLENYRRRAVDEQSEIRRNAGTTLLLKFLGVVDDIDRAIELMPADVAGSGWVDGLELIQRNMKSILDSEGVEKIEAKGRRFEPWEHEAVSYQETPDGEDGMVTDVFREGYKLHDRVLRAAQVVVSKAPAPKKDETETSEQETE
ncbi:MAG: nucleotide exchange factor GrpE [Chloroflexi bacterium]|nr:nucleotide exchange factor GrpE [Chloroflexota bacterium]